MNTQQQQNTNSFQVHKGRLPRLTIFGVIKQVSIDFKIQVMQSLFSGHKGIKLGINENISEKSPMFGNHNTHGSKNESKVKAESILNWVKTKHIKLWDESETTLKLIALNTYLREKKSQINELCFYLKRLKNNKKGRQKIINIRAEISETENQTKQNQWNQFFQEINKIDKPQLIKP